MNLGDVLRHPGRMDLRDGRLGIVHDVLSDLFVSLVYFDGTQFRAQWTIPYGKFSGERRGIRVTGAEGNGGANVE
jgi:hypothetical protein